MMIMAKMMMEMIMMMIMNEIGEISMIATSIYPIIYTLMDPIKQIKYKIDDISSKIKDVNYHIEDKSIWKAQKILNDIEDDLFYLTRASNELISEIQTLKNMSIAHKRKSRGELLYSRVFPNK